ncbi:MAG: c-type cytochrome [Pseudomonadota bacterium]
MLNRKTLHLWLLGAASFLAFGYAELHSMSVEASADQPETARTMPVTRESPTNAVEGQALYARRCGACHSLDANRIGPRHRGVVGREAGSLPDYDYSDALRRATFIWDAEILDRWLTNPEATAPGQKMGFRLSNADERAQIVAFLEANSETTSAIE